MKDEDAAATRGKVTGGFFEVAIPAGVSPLTQEARGDGGS